MVWNDKGFELGYIDTDLAPGFYSPAALIAHLVRRKAFVIQLKNLIQSRYFALLSSLP